MEFLPTVHEGATVRAMEKKGIRTEKGEFNRWIKATNAVIRDIKKKIALLFDWIAEAKAELAKPQAPDLVSLLNAYYTQRRAGAYSQKDKVSNLKEIVRCNFSSFSGSCIITNFEIINNCFTIKSCYYFGTIFNRDRKSVV